MRYITDQGVKYRIRGNYTAPQLRELYRAFIETVNARASRPERETRLTFRGWLVGFGKVYNRVQPVRGSK
jgi:hypothetical protein